MTHSSHSEDGKFDHTFHDLPLMDSCINIQLGGVVPPPRMFFILIPQEPEEEFHDPFSQARPFCVPYALS